MAKLQSAVKKVLDIYLPKERKITIWRGVLLLVGVILMITGALSFYLTHDVPLYGPGSEFWILPIVGIVMFMIGIACLNTAIAKLIHSTFDGWRESSYRAELLSVVKKLENKVSIWGADYGEFLIVLYRGTFSYDGKRQITNLLRDFILRKGRRISGHDYVELEKTLARAGKMKVDNKSVEIFPRWQIEGILSDYERLREKIRDRSLISP